MAGFWDSFGQGLQDAGAVMSADVYERQAKERQMQQRYAFAAQQQAQQQKAAMAQHVMTAIQSGAMDPAVGMQTLAKMGFNLPGMGPSADAQSHLAEIRAQEDWRKFAEQQQPRPGDINFQAANNEAMGLPPPQAGLQPGGLVQPHAPIPPALLGTKGAMRMLEADRMQADAAKEQRLAGAPIGTHYEPTTGQYIIVNPDRSVKVLQATAGKPTADKTTPFITEINAYRDLVASGKGNTPEARMLKAYIDRKDAPAHVSTGERSGYANVASDGHGGWVGLNKATNRMEAIPTAEGVKGSSGTIGNRESVFINRVILSGNEAARDLENVTKLPMTASRGIFGGRGQTEGIFNAGQETLANKMTTQEVQSYNVLATGFQRSLAAIESAGLVPSGSLTHQMDAVIYKEGDTNFTKLQKLAQTRQIVEAGLETIAANPRVPEETKTHITKILGRIEKSVPFTQSDLFSLSTQQQSNPKITLGDVIKARKASDVSISPSLSPEDRALIDKYKPKKN